MKFEYERKKGGIFRVKFDSVKESEDFSKMLDSVKEVSAQVYCGIRDDLRKGVYHINKETAMLTLTYVSCGRPVYGELDNVTHSIQALAGEYARNYHETGNMGILPLVGWMDAIVIGFSEVWYETLLHRYEKMWETYQTSGKWDYLHGVYLRSALCEIPRYVSHTIRRNVMEILHAVTESGLENVFDPGEDNVNAYESTENNPTKKTFVFPVIWGGFNDDVRLIVATDKVAAARKLKEEAIQSSVSNPIKIGNEIELDSSESVFLVSTESVLDDSDDFRNINDVLAEADEKRS